MTEGLILKKGGTVHSVSWNSDREEYVTSEQEVDVISNLFKSCTFEDDITLRDVFLLLQKDIPLYKKLLVRYIDEIVAEGLSGTEFIEDTEDEINYLELYYIISVNKYKENEAAEIDNFDMPFFHGVGSRKEEYGTTLNYCISYSPTYKYIDLPLKLKQDVIFCYYDEEKSIEDNRKSIHTYAGVNYTLGNILHAIIWELTWGGKPSDRNEFGKILFEDMPKDISSDSEDTD